MKNVFLSGRYIARFALLLALCVNQSNAAPDSPKSADEIVPLIYKYCGACHGVPDPSLLPKRSWPYVIKRMAELAEETAGREFIPNDDAKYITAYYYAASPENLPVLPYFQGSGSQTFAVKEIGRGSSIPLVINIKSADLNGGDSAEFVICDVARHTVSLLTLSGSRWEETVLGQVDMPIKTQLVDFDSDSDMDIIVADLGQFFPSIGKPRAGKVILLRQISPGTFNKEVLLEGVGRVTDARAVDMDGDKDLDLAVAIYGHDVPGKVIWLESRGKGEKYVEHVLSDLGGALNVSPVDLNHDGKIDIVSYLTQNHEKMAAFINEGDGKFKEILLFKASHPLVGVTDVSLADLDKDGDIDVLFTAGDAHDLQPDPKPYHGVQWLENKGDYQFQLREIGRFYGAATARVGDVDGDGDLDVVASSWNNFWDDPRRQTLAWFENDGKQNFTGRNIINRPNSIVSFELEDVTADNRLDIIAGVFKVDLLEEYVDKRLENETAGDKFLKTQKEKARIIKLVNTKQGQASKE